MPSDVMQPKLEVSEDSDDPFPDENVSDDENPDIGVTDLVRGMPVARSDFSTQNLKSECTSSSCKKTRKEKSTKEVPKNFSVPVECELCKKLYKNNKMLSQHMKSVHAERTNYICETCGKCFKNKSAHLSHSKRHFEEPQIPCTNCDKKFHTKTILMYHLNACLNLKNLQCQHCGARFNHRGSLRRHIQSFHTTEAAYMCKVCSKKFKILSKLKQHEIIHTSEKPFKCSFCDKAFNKFWNFKQHERLHTGSKPYKCDLCQESFRHNVTMKQHRTKHFVGLDGEIKEIEVDTVKPPVLHITQQCLSNEKKQL